MLCSSAFKEILSSRREVSTRFNAQPSLDGSRRMQHRLTPRVELQLGISRRRDAVRDKLKASDARGRCFLAKVTSATMGHTILGRVSYRSAHCSYVRHWDHLYAELKARQTVPCCQVSVRSSHMVRMVQSTSGTEKELMSNTSFRCGCVMTLVPYPRPEQQEVRRSTLLLSGIHT